MPKFNVGDTAWFRDNHVIRSGEIISRILDPFTGYFCYWVKPFTAPNAQLFFYANQLYTSYAELNAAKDAEKTPEIKLDAPKECKHNWKRYEGLTEVDYYCTECNEVISVEEYATKHTLQAVNAS